MVYVAQSKVLEFLQRRTLNIIFPGGDSTNLIIANVETPSHDDSNSHSFFQTVMSLRSTIWIRHLVLARYSRI